MAGPGCEDGFVKQSSLELRFFFFSAPSGMWAGDVDYYLHTHNLIPVIFFFFALFLSRCALARLSDCPLPAPHLLQEPVMPRDIFLNVGLLRREFLLIQMGSSLAC